MFKKLCSLTVIAFAFSGCATSSGVVPMGPDTFMVSRQAGSGFGGLGSLKADAFKEASAFCSTQKKYVRVVNTQDSQPPYILGNFPRTEVQFSCVDGKDADTARPKSQSITGS